MARKSSRLLRRGGRGFLREQSQQPQAGNGQPSRGDALDGTAPSSAGPIVGRSVRNVSSPPLTSIPPRQPNSSGEIREVPLHRLPKKRRARDQADSSGGTPPPS